MPPASVNEERVVDVDVLGLNVLVSYRPGGILLLAAATDTVNAVQATCLLVSSWDLVDDDNKVIPVCVPALASVPVPVLLTIIDAVVRDAEGRQAHERPGGE